MKWVVLFVAAAAETINLESNWTISFVADRSVKCAGADIPISVAACYKQVTGIDVNYGFNDVKLNSWLGKVPARLEKTFYLPALGSDSYFLRLSDLDTVAQITLNKRQSWESDNFYAAEVIDVSKSLVEGTNQLIIDIAPPITEAAKRAKAGNQPPNCPPDVQHGQCHVNWLRKPAYSFSWDWGPSLPDSGLYTAPVLYTVPSWKIQESSLALVSKFTDRRQVVRADFLIQTKDTNYPVFDQVKVVLSNGAVQIELVEQKFTFFVTLVGNNTFHFFGELDCPTDQVQWWWPNGHGGQSTYTATVTVFGSGRQEQIDSYFAFRTVQLMQESVEDGTSFYFKINDKPIFMSGSNWIPAAPVVPEGASKVRQLLTLARQAGIKMLRVWGGGYYETDDFYVEAAKQGITIWQDFMFACATYTDQPNFLDSVRNEVKAQLWRLAKHPAIVVLAGNNENEAALATNWYDTDKNKQHFYDQYRRLYVDTIRDEFMKLNMSVPFVSSSPTNGIVSEQSLDWIAPNPYDPNHGDVHYYNYKDDCRDWSKFPKTRFASEFGYQASGLRVSV